MKYLLTLILLSISLSSFAEPDLKEMVGEGKGGMSDCYTDEMIACDTGCQVKCLEKNSAQHKNFDSNSGGGKKTKGTKAQGDV